MTARDNASITILGIDPGSRITGYGIITAQGDKLAVVDAGGIKTGKGDFQDRLKIIFASVRSLVEETEPDEIAIERVFVNRNADSALKLGHARAAALCATFGSEIPVHEYAAREIKQAIVGRGGADKVQVQHMVRMLLSLKTAPQADAADALAVAICHAHTRLTAGRLAAAVGGGR
ncbi:MAG: crossover junction endodeoxyribonuclease RuvC [Gammaproteobacteria bacterium]|nr:crossover junction endodeoxyribonuclease RuvC [Gammaproteobacteria bacterium]